MLSGMADGSLVVLASASATRLGPVDLVPLIQIKQTHGAEGTLQTRLRRTELSGERSNLSEQLHPMAPHHLPFYHRRPERDGRPDGGDGHLPDRDGPVGRHAVLRLHSLPERMAHKSQKLQFEIVAVLGLMSLFTHIHIFWVAGLLLAMIDLPDFGTPLRSIAGSVEKHCRHRRRRRDAAAATRSRSRTTASSSRRRARRKEGGAQPCLSSCSAHLSRSCPDYLYRRYRQGKRFGKEITFFSVWYELSWGIIALPDADDLADHDDLLFPSVDHLRSDVISGRCRSCPKAPAASRRSTSASRSR